MFELLIIIKTNKWRDTIIELKQGRFPANNNLDKMETRLIKRIVSHDPQDHPNDVSEVLEVIDRQINTTGKQTRLLLFCSNEGKIGIIRFQIIKH